MANQPTQPLTGYRPGDMARRAVAAKPPSKPRRTKRAPATKPAAPDQGPAANADLAEQQLADREPGALRRLDHPTGCDTEDHRLAWVWWRARLGWGAVAPWPPLTPAEQWVKGVQDLWLTWFGVR